MRFRGLIAVVLSMVAPLAAHAQEPATAAETNGTRLSDYYDAMVASQEDNSASLIVNRTYSGDDLWSSTQARNLTYCVSTQFGSYHSTIVNAMAQGAALSRPCGAQSGRDAACARCLSARVRRR